MKKFSEESQNTILFLADERIDEISKTLTFLQKTVVSTNSNKILDMIDTIYNNLFAFPCEIRLQEIYIHIFFFYDKMLGNFEICI